MKKSQNSRNKGFLTFFCLMIEGSCSWSGSVKQLPIRIRETQKLTDPDQQHWWRLCNVVVVRCASAWRTRTWCCPYRCSWAPPLLPTSAAYSTSYTSSLSPGTGYSVLLEAVLRSHRSPWPGSGFSYSCGSEWRFHTFFLFRETLSR